MSDVRIARAEGDPATRGRTIGKTFSDLIECSIDFYHRYLDARGVSSPDLQELLTPHLAAAEAVTPDLMAMITGMAEGAMVPVMELFAVNAFEELEPLLKPLAGQELFLERKEGHRAERCTSFTSVGDGYTLLAHNENWLAGDLGNVGVVLEIPDEGRASIASASSVCCLPSVGMNSFGEAQGIASLTASDDRAGVPRVFESRYTFDANDREDAIQRAGLEHRAGGYGHVFAFRGGDALRVETTATKMALFDGAGAHTNHYLDPDLAEMAPPPSKGSLNRYERTVELLDELNPSTPEAMMEILRDHENAPTSICLHPDPTEGDEAEAVVFSIVCELEAKRMWVAVGIPCETEYQEIDLEGVI